MSLNLTSWTRKSGLLAAAATLVALASPTAQASCPMGEGLGYVSGSPWQVGSAVRKGGFFSNFAPGIKTGNASPMYREKTPEGHRRWTLALERNGQSIDWFNSSFAERSVLLQGDLETLVKEVTFRQIVREIAPDGREKEVGRTDPLRAVYYTPILVGHKFAEKHGTCTPSERQAGTTPNLGVKQKRYIRVDESCVFTQDHTDVRHAGNEKKEKTQQHFSLLMVSGHALTSYIDGEIARLVSKEKASEYMDQLHVAFLASIEKLAAVESENQELEEDEKILAQKFYNCREEREVSGVNEEEFVKRVFGK